MTPTTCSSQPSNDVNKEEIKTIKFEENALSICMTKLQDDSIGNVFNEDNKTIILGANLDQSSKDYEPYGDIDNTFEGYEDSCILSSNSLRMPHYDIHNEVLEAEIVILESFKFDEDASWIKSEMKRINRLLEGDLSNEPEFIAGIESVVTTVDEFPFDQGVVLTSMHEFCKEDVIEEADFEKHVLEDKSENSL